MSSDKFPSSTLKNPLFLAFAVPCIYWIYLLFSSQMTVQNDSISYENLGRLLAQNQWVEYFKTGPNREPVYPLLVSISMRLADLLSFSYQKILIVFQFILLFLTQLLSLKILKKLQVKTIWCALAVFYIGISPALVNSALSLYSEIAAYPFILGIVLLGSLSWQGLKKHASGRTIFLRAAGLGACFVLATLTKAIFELIFPLFLIPFFWLGFRATREKNFSTFKNTLLFLITVLVIFYAAISAYKSLNKTYNGEFVVTSRGAWALYGNTDRRMEPLNSKRFLAALAYVPGEGVCRKLSTDEECHFWSFRESDGRGYLKSSELTQTGMDNAQVNQELIKLSLERIRQNPSQYALLTTLEGLKMLFWESTQIGWVIYPQWLDELFRWGPLKDGLRLIMFLLTAAGLIYSIIFTWKKRSESSEIAITASIMLLLIILFVGLHSFFFILTRYALPIAPLFIILIAFWLNKISKT